jgi:hypothetical protein
MLMAVTLSLRYPRAPGEQHERVLERRRFHLDFPGGQVGRRQREDHGADQIPRSGHEYPLAVTLDALHLREPGQQPVVERPRWNEPHPLAAARPLG